MSARGAALAVAAVALLRGLLVAAVIPPFHGVDEPAHFDYAQRLLEARALPEASAGCQELSPEVRAAVEALVVPTAFRPDRPLPDVARLSLPDPRQGWSRSTRGCGAAAAYPPLYYATVALAMLPLQRAPLFWRLYAARAATALWAALGAVLAALGALWLFGTARDALLVGLLVALQPMLSFLGSVVNNDAALVACCAGALAGIAHARQSGGSGRSLFLLLVSALGAALVKPTLLALLPALGLLTLAALGARRRVSWAFAVAALLPAAATALSWTLAASAAGLERPLGEPRALGVQRYVLEQVLQPKRLHFLWTKMYWMAWGWADTWLPDLDYLAVDAALLCAALAVLLSWRKLQPTQRGLFVWGALATLLAVAALYGVELLWMRRTSEPLLQGRYLLGLFPLHAALLVSALRAPWNGEEYAPQPDPAWSLLLLMGALDVASVARAVVRYHG